MYLKVQEYNYAREHLWRDLKLYLGIEEPKYLNIEEACKAQANYWRKLNPKTEEAVNHFYKTADDYIWENYYWNISRSCKAKARHLISILSFYKIKSICEIGPGIGTDALCLAMGGADMHVLQDDNASFRFFEWRNRRLNANVKIVKQIPYELDCITFFDVIEHILNPYSFIDFVCEKRPKYICLTQACQVHEETRGGHPQHYDFTYNSIEKQIFKNGYEKVKIKQMAFPPKLYKRIKK